MLVLVALFIVAAFYMLRSPGPMVPATASTTTLITGHGPTTTAPQHSRSKVRVQVANGTTTSGLAGTYTQRLLTLGWDTLPKLNANNKVSATVIYFNPGFRWAAQQIAGELKVSSSGIQPLNGLVPAAGANNDDVIVVVGPDLATAG